MNKYANTSVHAHTFCTYDILVYTNTWYLDTIFHYVEIKVLTRWEALMIWCDRMKKYVNTVKPCSATTPKLRPPQNKDYFLAVLKLHLHYLKVSQLSWPLKYIIWPVNNGPIVLILRFHCTSMHIHVYCICRYLTQVYIYL